MNRSDLAAKLARKENLPRSEAKAVVKLVFRLFGDAMKQRDRIEIRGFGSFVLRDYETYTGRNPKTGETIEVRPKGSTYFKTGKELKEKLNGTNISVKNTSEKGARDPDG